VLAQHLHHFFANDLYDLLGGREGGEHLLPHGLLFYRFDKLLGDLEMDVGFEQRHADFAQSRLHVFRR
jgi:hypothetical protein